MFLREKDKEWIYEAIKEATRNVVTELIEEHLPKLIEAAVTGALTAEIDWEKHRDEKTGQPLAHPERVKERIFLPAFWVQHLKFHEGAYRGFQEDINKTNNRVRSTMLQNKAIAKILLGSQKALEDLARFAVALRETGLLSQLEKIGAIEYEGMGGPGGGRPGEPRAIENRRRDGDGSAAGE